VIGTVHKKYRGEKKMTEVLRGLKEISTYLKISTDTTKTYYKEFNLPVIKLPSGRYYARPEELDRWLEEMKRV
jgi:predicted site-specific integrase-resolvase